MLKEKIVKVKDREIAVYLTDNDKNGNGRAIVHYSELGLDKYISIAKHTPMKKYTGKAFGGGYIFQTYSLEYTLEKTLDLLQEHYRDSLWDSE